MKHLLTLMALLAVFFSFNSHANFVGEGRVVNQGALLECRVENYSIYNIALVNYWFEMTVRDNYGRNVAVNDSRACTSNCLVLRNTAEHFYGSNLAYNVLAARCFFNYVVR